MGLTSASTGIKAKNEALIIKKKNENERIIALAGNPNVGKSTIFNALTGLNQHTGNWPGKTVSNAVGYFGGKDTNYVLVDIPGTYSLFAHSPEEEIARNFICFSKKDAVIVVCDASCLERNLNLVLQTIETGSNVLVCVNLLDEAKRKGIKIDLEKLSSLLNVPVVGTVAKNKKSLKSLVDTLDKNVFPDKKTEIRYPDIIETAIEIIISSLDGKSIGTLNKRWLSLKLLEDDSSFLYETEKLLGFSIKGDEKIKSAVEKAKKHLKENGAREEILKDFIVGAVVSTSEKIAAKVTSYDKNEYNSLDRKLDNILTSKRFGYPIMILLLLIVLWITIFGANIISDGITSLFATFEKLITAGLIKFGTPEIIRNIIIEGVLRVPLFVISVMLPPMAIFFPLFTLLEDLGYLPRIAFNLDKPFKKCGSCGKQALTMCMGFGCNAAGVVGTRIVDSKREQLICAVTNSFVPCNGKFPSIIAVITMFFVPIGTAFGSVYSALILTGVILLGIAVTFAVTKLLSNTLLKGYPSSYTLEMPSYRKPQIGKILVHSVFDRTLFVLLRSITVALPAGMIIWLSANITIGENSVLTLASQFLEPIGRVFGLDGVILIAFILGFPANEIVFPIILMAYLSKNNLGSLPELTQIYNIFIANGWTVKTAVCTLIFSLFHWPCSTTVLTVKKETGKLKWALLSFILPTVVGFLICFFINLVFNLLV